MIYLKWLLYYMATQDDRVRYMLAQEKGYFCEGINNGVASFDTSRKPQDKSWITFKKFKKVDFKKGKTYIEDVKTGEKEILEETNEEFIWWEKKKCSMFHDDQNKHNHSYISSYVDNKEPKYPYLIGKFNTECKTCGMKDNRDVAFIIGRLGRRNITEAEAKISAEEYSGD